MSNFYKQPFKPQQFLAMYVMLHISPVTRLYCYSWKPGLSWRSPESWLWPHPDWPEQQPGLSVWDELRQAVPVRLQAAVRGRPAEGWRDRPRHQGGVGVLQVRVEHSHWSTSLEIPSSHWLNLTIPDQHYKYNAPNHNEWGHLVPCSVLFWLDKWLVAPLYDKDIRHSSRRTFCVSLSLWYM